MGIRQRDEKRIVCIERAHGSRFFFFAEPLIFFLTDHLAAMGRMGRHYVTKGIKRLQARAHVSKADTV